MGLRTSHVYRSEIDDTVWPEPIELKTWATNQLGIIYPKMGVELLPYDPKNDPFERLVAETTNS